MEAKTTQTTKKIAKKASTTIGTAGLNIAIPALVNSSVNVIAKGFRPIRLGLENIKENENRRKKRMMDEAIPFVAIAKNSALRDRTRRNMLVSGLVFYGATLITGIYAGLSIEKPSHLLIAAGLAIYFQSHALARFYSFYRLNSYLSKAKAQPPIDILPRPERRGRMSMDQGRDTPGSPVK